jgi:hypothetical protein
VVGSTIYLFLQTVSQVDGIKDKKKGKTEGNGLPVVGRGTFNSFITGGWFLLYYYFVCQ